MRVEGREAEFRFVLGFGGLAVVFAGVRTGEARIGVNGVKVSGEVKFPRTLRVTSSLLCVRASVG